MFMSKRSPQNHKSSWVLSLPCQAELQRALDDLIISASGWRKVFSEGGAESFSPKVSAEDCYLTFLAAYAFASHLPVESDKPVVVATDSRPSGPALAEIVIRTLLASDFKVNYLGIAPAPEIMAYSNEENSVAFFYISASHNPIGHNGFKMGHNGAVYTSQELEPIKERFLELINQHSLPLLPERYHLLGPYGEVLSQQQKCKADSLVAYEELLNLCASGQRENSALLPIITQIEQHPLGIVGELNGSARCLSLDRHYLEKMGVKTYFINTSCGKIVHSIIPEGENLEECRQALEAQFAHDRSFQIGYVPDNDGDRGNLVYIEHSSGKAKILGAQELFALVAIVESVIALRSYTKVALAVNGPTSLMLDSVARQLGVSLFRAEVGEANVVALGNQLRSQGYYVRLVGEGSNGGAITYPAKVRDPLNMLTTLIKLLSDPTLFAEVAHSCQRDVGTELTIEAALALLPQRQVTPVASPEGVVAIKTTNIGVLKARYEELFVSDYQQRQRELKERFTIATYQVEQTEGTTCRLGMGPQFRSGQERGGLKVLFLDEKGEPSDFLWLRPSGTEPLFRVMVDTLGRDMERYDYFVRWQHSLVQRADSL